MATRSDMAQEMDLIYRALTSARIYVAGHDQADSIRKGSEKITYSALRTLIEQAEKAAAYIVDHLAPAQGDEPCCKPHVGRDGGPL